MYVFVNHLNFLVKYIHVYKDHTWPQKKKYNLHYLKFYSGNTTGFREIKLMQNNLFIYPKYYTIKK